MKPLFGQVIDFVRNRARDLEDEKYLFLGWHRFVVARAHQGAARAPPMSASMRSATRM